MAQQRWLVRRGSDVGRGIAEIRATYGVPQGDLAQQIGIGRTWLSKLEHGRTNVLLDVLIRALRALNASIVIEFDDERPPTMYTGSARDQSAEPEIGSSHTLMRRR